MYVQSEISITYNGEIQFFKKKFGDLLPVEVTSLNKYC